MLTVTLLLKSQDLSDHWYTAILGQNERVIRLWNVASAEPSDMSVTVAELFGDDLVGYMVTDFNAVRSYI